MVYISGNLKAKLSTDQANALKPLQATSLPQQGTCLPRSQGGSSGSRNVPYQYVNPIVWWLYDREWTRRRRHWDPEIAGDMGQPLVIYVYLPLYFAIKARITINYALNTSASSACGDSSTPRVHPEADNFLLKIARWVHPEPLLLNILSSTDEQDAVEEFAVEYILKTQVNKAIDSNHGLSDSFTISRECFHKVMPFNSFYCFLWTLPSGIIASSSSVTRRVLAECIYVIHDQSAMLSSFQ